MVDINQIPTRRPFHRRRKTCPFSGANAPKIDYKDVRLLQRYISERARSMRRASPVSQKKQREPPRRSSAPLPRPAALRGPLTAQAAGGSPPAQGTCRDGRGRSQPNPGLGSIRT
jgi:small subunit ribosomal protein S18